MIVIETTSVSLQVRLVKALEHAPSSNFLSISMNKKKPQTLIHSRSLSRQEKHTNSPMSLRRSNAKSFFPLLEYLFS